MEQIWAVHMVLMEGAGSREKKLGMGEGCSGAALLMAGEEIVCVGWSEGHILLRDSKLSLGLWSRSFRRVLVGGPEVYEPPSTPLP